MRVLFLVALPALLLALPTHSYPDGTPARAVAVVADRPSMPETQPTSKPATPAKQDTKAPSVDDEIKALGFKPMNVNTGMGRIKTAKLEAKLKAWEGNGAANEFAEARKAGVMLAALAKAVEWSKHKKRSKDPGAFDEIVKGLESSARKLADAAGKKDADAVKEASGQVSRNCSNCHSQFR